MSYLNYSCHYYCNLLVRSDAYFFPQFMIATNLFFCPVSELPQFVLAYSLLAYCFLQKVSHCCSWKPNRFPWLTSRSEYSFKLRDPEDPVSLIAVFWVRRSTLWVSTDQFAFSLYRCQTSCRGHFWTWAPASAEFTSDWPWLLGPNSLQRGHRGGWETLFFGLRCEKLKGIARNT